ncbi:MAG: hypothetical protein HRU25_08040 [Psychrobium sp.]|nr:hypothetical protein [Psychrobium sp.]
MIHINSPQQSDIVKLLAKAHCIAIDASLSRTIEMPIHVFVHYSGNTNAIYLTVTRCADYSNKDISAELLFSKTVYLGWDNPLQKLRNALTALESTLANITKKATLEVSHG